MHLGDEKKMPFRKNLSVNSEFTANSLSSDSFVGVPSEDSNKLSYDVEAHKKLTKAILCGIVDGTLTDAFRFVEFKWSKPQAPEFTTVVEPAYK